MKIVLDQKSYRARFFDIFCSEHPYPFLFFHTQRLRTSFLFIIIEKIISMIFDLRVSEKTPRKNTPEIRSNLKKSCTIFS